MNDFAHKTRTRRLIWSVASVAALLVSANALAQEALAGSDLIMPANGPSNADMVILKTAAMGSASSFSVAVSNTGPVAVTGAVVTDNGGTDGFCNKNNSVTITGDGVPDGSFTISNLSGSGITLGTLQPGQTATLTYSCQGK